MIENDSSDVEDGLDLCVCQPYVENMKEISFEAIRNRTKYIRLRSSDTVEWLKCKYCDVRICCRLDDDEDFVDYEEPRSYKNSHRKVSKKKIHPNHHRKHCDICLHLMDNIRFH